MITIKEITQANFSDVNIPNEPFKIWGKMVPSLNNGQWSYTTQKFLKKSTMCFPNENYQYDKNKFYFGAYDNEKCIGLAIYSPEMFSYLYLDDLKININYRHQGIGAKLIQKGVKEAEKQKLQGIYTIAQDNNLSACLFYLKQGFEIGGFNNRNYRGTSQEGKADIYFYRDC